MGFGASVLALTFLLGFGGAPAHAATTINLSTNVLVPQVKRFGIGLAQHNYYDSAQMMKELLFRNPGFEGQLYQSVVRLGPGGTAGSAIEDQPFTQWPSGFWAGASYEIIWSSANAKGRTGTIANSLAPLRANPPSDPNGSSQGTTYLFADSDPAKVPADGDYMVLRKTDIGGTGGGAAFASWSVSTSGGGTVTSETGDLPPPPAPLPAGRQCARLSAASAGQQASVTGQFDTTLGFIRLNGQFRLAFKAKGTGGQNQVLITVRRGSLTPYLSKTIQLGTGWQDVAEPFTVNEPADISGTISVQFSAVNQSAVLLDDVSLRQTDGSAGNPTEFRDGVVSALQGLRPGILRYVNWQDVGDSLDNSLAPVFSRKRSGYSVYSTAENNMMPGLHEFLVLCEHVGSEPWYSIPVTFSTQEVASLMEYLGGATTTPYGGLRAARGHPAPWTGVFPRIHLEFGNENWNNSAYRGAAITAAVPCGNRASELFAVIKSSPYHAGGQFQCFLGGQAGNSALNLQLHNASPLHDSLNLAPYMSSRVDSFETAGQVDAEKLFGPLFAEPEWWSYNPSPTSGLMRASFDSLQASSRPVPVSVYEVNLHTTQGTISQAALDSYTPSVGAALAVADHMLVMLRELNCRDQVFFSLAGHRYSLNDGTGRTSALWGAVLDMGKTDRKRPHYHAMQLINAALAGNLVATTHTGDDPTWTVNNLNRVTYTNAHHLQSHAFASGTNRSLIVFNLHRTSALDVNFAGGNVPSGTVTLKRLTSANITDHNETASVVVPTTNTLANFNPAQNLTLPPFSMSLFEWSTAAPAAAPAITTQPQSQVVIAGTNVTLSVTATGVAPLSYQWQRNSVNLTGATLATLTLTNVTRASTGTYTARVSNSNGTTNSQPATVRVLNFPRLHPPQPLPGGGLRLLFNDHDGGTLGLGDTPNFEVWASTNLLSTNWVRINLPLTVTDGMLTLDDADAAIHRHRYYRVVER
ncbi:MAG: immunoglobulin domain-containing protein [Limisphaerales bacterium]